MLLSLYLQKLLILYTLLHCFLLVPTLSQLKTLSEMQHCIGKIIENNKLSSVSKDSSMARVSQLLFLISDISNKPNTDKD